MHTELYQAAFNKAYHGVIAQGSAAIEGNAGPRYVCADGKRCNLGHVFRNIKSINRVPFGCYFKGVSIVLDTSQQELDALVRSQGFDETDNEFLTALRCAHDGCCRAGVTFMNDYMVNMINLATKFNLSIPL